MADIVKLGEFNGTIIQARPVDRYANATQMCNATDKKWNDYWRTQETQDFLVALAAFTGIPANELVASKKGNPAHGGGTWVHPKVALHLAQWCSAAFAVQVTFWLDELLTKGRVSIDPQEQQLALVLAQLNANIQANTQTLQTQGQLLTTLVGRIEKLEQGTTSQQFVRTGSWLGIKERIAERLPDGKPADRNKVLREFRTYCEQNSILVWKPLRTKNCPLVVDRDYMTILDQMIDKAENSMATKNSQRRFDFAFVN